MNLTAAILVPSLFAIALLAAADFGDDAVAGIARLASMPEIDPARIGLPGDSEGAAPAAIAAATSPAVRFVVMLAGLPGDVVTRREAADDARAMGAGTEAVAKIEAAHRAMTGAVRRDASVEEITVALKYATLEKTFLPGLRDDVTTWIQTATRR